MAFPKGRLILRLVGIFLIAALIVGHEAGLRLDGYTMHKALNYVAGRMPKAVGAFLGITGAASAPAGNDAAAVGSGIL